MLTLEGDATLPASLFTHKMEDVTSSFLHGSCFLWMLQSVPGKTFGVNLGPNFLLRCKLFSQTISSSVRIKHKGITSLYMRCLVSIIWPHLPSSWDDGYLKCSLLHPVKLTSGSGHHCISLLFPVTPHPPHDWGPWWTLGNDQGMEQRQKHWVFGSLRKLWCFSKYTSN